MAEFVKVGRSNINLDNVLVASEYRDGGFHIHMVGDADWMAFDGPAAADLHALFANVRTARQIVVDRKAEQAPDYETLLRLLWDATNIIQGWGHLRAGEVRDWQDRATAVLRPQQPATQRDSNDYSEGAQ